MDKLKVVVLVFLVLYLISIVWRSIIAWMDKSKIWWKQLAWAIELVLLMGLIAYVYLFGGNVKGVGYVASPQTYDMTKMNPTGGKF